MKKIALLLFLLFNITSAENYFQQQVDYNISAELLPGENSVSGSEYVIYHNNSPDKLDTLYFYLYLNAFKPGSNLFQELHRWGYYRFANLPENLQGGVELGKIIIDGLEIKSFKIDDTILILKLPQGLNSGDSLIINFEFVSKIPPRGYRMGRRGNHFDIGQWFPKAAVYDKYGWHTSQYQSMGEFYSDFGTYNVRLTAPKNYLIAHCGNLLNEEEVYGSRLPVPGQDSLIVNILGSAAIKDTTEYQTLRFEPNVPNAVGEQNTISGTLHSITSEPDSTTKPSGIPIYGPPDSLFAREILDLPFRGLTDYSEEPATRTWIFQLNYAHDFAFSAAPDFLIDRTYSDGVIIDCYYSRRSARFWSPRAVETSREAIDYFSRLVGPYAYDHYTLVSGTVFGGIEYPTLSMVSSYDAYNLESHSFENVIAHEIAHNWFYGMIANNQAEQAFIDEGYAMFLACLFIEHKYGRYHNDNTYSSEWRARLLPNGNYRDYLQKTYFDGVYLGLDASSATPANQFQTRRTYTLASYDKPAAVLFHLQYVMGDSNFVSYVHEIYKRWRFRHPYLSDLADLAHEISGRDLRYFFHQWYETSWHLDYSIDGVKSHLISKDEIQWYRTEIELGNHGRCISPLDLVVTFGNGEIDTLRLPESIWADGSKKYKYTVDLPLKPSKIVINPDGRIPDIYRLNNRWRWPAIESQFDTPKLIYKDSFIDYKVDSYTIAHKAHFWYNEVDGFKIGYGVHGSYLGLKNNLDANTAVGTISGRVDFDFAYDNLLSISYPGFRYKLRAAERDGRGRQYIGLDYTSRPDNRISSLRATLAYERVYLYDDNYLSFPARWQHGSINTLNLTVERPRNYRNFDTFWSADLTASAPGSDFRFSRATLIFKTDFDVTDASRVTLSIMDGLSEGDVPAQYRFYLGEASPYESYFNHWFAARGTLPTEWKRDGHLFVDDGFSMPGYLPQGQSGLKKLVGRINIRFSNPASFFDLPGNFFIREFSKISTNIYLTHGVVWSESGLPRASDFKTETGFQFSYSFPFWDRLFGDERIYLYLPLIISSPPHEENNLKFRWALTISSS